MKRLGAFAKPDNLNPNPGIHKAEAENQSWMLSYDLRRYTRTCTYVHAQRHYGELCLFLQAFLLSIFCVCDLDMCKLT